MKLSRYTLALCLAATIGLSVPARQAKSQGGLDYPTYLAEKSGSPSYQAAQNYDSYDCFASGCHSGYGDILPDLNHTDESNVRLEGMPPEPVNVDADLPGDEPTRRAIPTSTTQASPSPSPNYGFARGNEVPQTIPPRGYFSPGYPHPGYQHPSYGYSHTEPASPALDDAAELTEQQVTAEAAAEESLANKAVAKSAASYANWPFQAAIAEAMLAEGCGEDTLASECLEEESLEEEPVAKTATEDLSQEYARYDDTYGFESEWFGPYDATKVAPKPVANSEVATKPSLPADYTLTSQFEDRIEEVDPAPAMETADEPIVDYGPAELEVDATTAVDSSAADEDAAFEAALRNWNDEWTYRETYGYGPRYDYDAYGYEDFPAAKSEAKSNRSWNGIWKLLSAASTSFPWDYVNRLELGNLKNYVTELQASVQIPYAPGKPVVSTPASDDDLFYLVADDDAQGMQEDPAIPASSDFDPAAMISHATRLLSQIDGKQLAEDAAWLSRTLTPMELAHLALASTPVAERGHISILVPQPKVVKIEPFDPELNADMALRKLALMLDDAGRALQMLSRRVEAYADATSPVPAAGDVTPLQSRNPASSEKR